MNRILAIAILTLPLAFAADKLAPLDESGYQQLVAANKGKVVLVDFWATWCKPCRAEMPELATLDARLKAKGLKLITVSADEPEKEAEAQKFAAQSGIVWPAYIRKAKDDDKFINSVDPKWSGALPAMILYDKTGKRVKSFIGETPVKDIEAAITKLL